MKIGVAGNFDRLPVEFGVFGSDDLVLSCT